MSRVLLNSDTSQASRSNKKTDEDRGKNGVGAGKDHINGGLGAHTNAFLDGWFTSTLAKSRNFPELVAHFNNNCLNSLSDGKHGKGTEQE